MDLEKMIRDLYPYAEEFGVARRMPEEGIPQDTLLEQLKSMATREDGIWQDGRCSGTMYCGDREHYDFMNQCFALYSHMNALQRDMCLSMNRFESEIIAMTLELFHGEAVEKADPSQKACGSINSGGTESILNAMVAYRDWARAERGIERPEMIWPVTAHPAFHKAAHLFGYTLIAAPVDPVTTLVDVNFIREHITPNTAVIIASAGNYPYGTVDPIVEIGELAKAAGVGFHVDGCLGGFILAFAEELGVKAPLFDFRVPGVTSISADTHKYGYGLKGTSVLMYRDKSLRAYQQYALPDWRGGAYGSPGLLGSRSGGLIAATWAGMMRLGRAGYLSRAKKVFETSFAMQEVVKRHPELILMGSPTFCFSFRSDVVNVYHINDYMKTRGWRFNGQQYPDAVHLCVTGPQTHEGVVERFAEDLAAGLAYAKEKVGEDPQSSGMYGLGSGGGIDLTDPFIAKMVISTALDAFVDCPLPV